MTVGRLKLETKVFLDYIGPILFISLSMADQMKLNEEQNMLRTFSMS